MLLLYLDIDKLSICDKNKLPAKHPKTEHKIMTMKQQYFEHVSEANIKRSENGKPIFETLNSNSNSRFNSNKNLYIGVSDSGKYKAYAISKDDFAIDLEYIQNRNRKFIDIAEYCFHQTEIELLKNSSDTKADFFALWTLKEAFIKLHDKTVFDIRNTPSFDIQNHSYQYENDKYAFICYQIQGGYILSVAYYQTSQDISIISNSLEIEKVLYQTPYRENTCKSY